jgi:hypothetical protein
LQPQFHLAKLPKFLNIEPTPFSPETYDSSLAQNVGDMTQQEFIRRQVESTMRWRKIVDERGKLVGTPFLEKTSFSKTNNVQKGPRIECEIG